MACLNCRSRKLKCDKTAPICSNCSKSGRECEYDARPKKRGPKKRNLKALEERLTFLEQGIKSEDSIAARSVPSNDSQQPGEDAGHRPFEPHPSNAAHSQSEFPSDALNASNFQESGVGDSSEMLLSAQSFTGPFFSDFGGGLGFDFNGTGFEALPTLIDTPAPDVSNALLEIYFDHIHIFSPIVHRLRYLQGNPPLCLQYAIWAVAALWSNEYRDQAEGFYRKARRYLEDDEISGSGEAYLNLGHCQAWVILTFFDSLNHNVVRITLCSRRANALCQMFGLDRVDAEDRVRRKILPYTTDWVEQEERRRTFWAAFCVDRWSSASHGWASSIDEAQIFTNLPASEKAFQEGIEEHTMTLDEALAEGFNENTSYFAAQTLMNLVLGRNVLFLHRRQNGSDTKAFEEGLKDQHRYLDNTLSKLLVTLPQHLQLVTNLRDPLALHLNMTLNGSIISLHLATIAKLEKSIDPNMRKRSLQYAYVAAEEVMNCLRLSAHIGVDKLHPFAGFAMFMAAHAFMRVEDGPFTEQRNRENLDLILAVAHKHHERYHMLWPVFARLCLDIDQTKYHQAVTKRYREISHRLIESEGKNSYIVQRMKEHPMPGLLPRTSGACRDMVGEVH